MKERNRMWSTSPDRLGTCRYGGREEKGEQFGPAQCGVQILSQTRSYLFLYYLLLILHTE